jgi:hypothetical protein
MQPDIAQLIDEICDVLSSNELVSPDRAQDLASRYQTACEETNRRLREAHLRLSRGMRSEAIQLCEEEPNLLDLVALLDMPSRPAFSELLSFADVAAPPRVAVELAAELNDAYAAELPLKTLMKQHRLLALRRASLTDRIRVIRRILDLDASQPGWIEDLKSFEAARTREIREEARLAFQQEDLEILESLLEELHADGWRYPPSQSICGDVQSKVDELAARRARIELVGIEAELNHAHSALDIQEGRLLRTKWLQLSKLARIDQRDPLQERVEPALEWLTEEDERDQQAQLRETATRRLEQSLEEGDSREALDIAYREVSRFEDGAEPLLESRYRERIREIELAEFRRRRLRTASIAVATLLLAGLTAVLVRSHRHSNAIAASQETLKRHMDAMKLDEAVVYLDGLPEEIRGSDVVRSVALDLDRMVSAEKKRLRSFSAALKSFEDSGTEKPEVALLDQADRLARLPAEKERVKQLRAEAEVTALEKMNRDTKDYLRRIQAYTDEMSSVTILPDIRLRSIENDLNDLLERYRHLTPALLSQGETLRGRIQTMRRRVAEVAAREGLQTSTTEAVGDHGAYMRCLQELADKETDTDRQEGLRQIVREDSPLWGTMTRWQALVGHASWNSLAKLNCEDAPRMIDELRSVSKLLEEQFELPTEIREDLASKQLMLERIAGRQEGDSPPLDRLAQLSGNPLMSGMAGKGLWLIKASDNAGRPSATYYSYSKPLLNEDRSDANDASLVIDYIKNVSTQATGRTRRRMEGLDIEVAPQTLLAERMRELAAELKRDNVRNGMWESRLSQLIEQVYQQPDLNETLRFILLMQVIDIASQGSSSIEAGYSAVLRSLRAEPVDISANWIDPEDPAAEEACTQAAAALGRTRGRLGDAKRTASERFRSDVAPFVDRLRWVGWVAVDAEGRPTAQFKSSDVDGPIFLISTDGGKATRHEVGTAVQGAFSLNQIGDARFKYGRPLYALPSPEKAR